jgi:hypothetical protein
MNTITTGIDPITAEPRSRSSAITIGTVATFGHLVGTLTVFTRCTGPGHPLAVDMNVYFPHRAGTLEGGLRGVDVSSYSGWECLAR